MNHVVLARGCFEISFNLLSRKETLEKHLNVQTKCYYRVEYQKLPDKGCFRIKTNLFFKDILQFFAVKVNI